MPKDYVIGVSSGIWGVIKKEEVLGINKKLQWIATSGTNHVQVDLETINEFKEPDLKEKIERSKKSLNINFGIHGEARPIVGMDTLPLDSALMADYIRAHDRLMIHVKECSKLGAEYCTIHSSESKPFIVLWHELQSTNLCDFWGRPLREFLEENKRIAEWLLSIKDKPQLGDILRHIPSADYILREYLIPHYKSEHEGKMPDEKELKKLKEEAHGEAVKRLINFVNSGESHYGGERIAYLAVAKWMQSERDYLWDKIVGRILDDKTMLTKTEKWVPAVAAKYIWGHFCPRKGGYPDPKPILKDKRMYFCFEAPMAERGYEGYMRLVTLTDIYYMCEAIGSPWVGMTMDMEHMMSCNIDPKKDIENLPPKGGQRLKVVHVTVPTPMNPSHLPVPLGSEAQLYIYERLYDLRKKGFKTGWWIFERGGEEGLIKDTVTVMRMIKKYLEKGVDPKKLPPEFFGMDMEAADWKTQVLKVKDHAFDPLKGLLVTPEEQMGVFGEAAKEKGKIAEWLKEKYR
ncbi:MAG: hypothetical protein ACE5J7_01460 [Candidatus Aenigmatarchaeota archaeon]